jgi:HEAT repeat protein
MAAVMVLSLLLSIPFALADISSDLVLAADSSLSQDSRQAAFDRVISDGAMNPSPVVTASQASEDTRLRWVAIRALGHIGSPPGRAALVGLLEDPEPAIRTAAVSALGDVGDRAYSRRVAELLNDPAVIVRAAAAGTLGTLRDPSAISALEDALSSPGSYYRGSSLWVRQHYVAALGAIGDMRALPALLRSLDDDDENVADTSLRALEQISGVSFADGRDPVSEREAWRRWTTAQIQRRNLR